MGNCFSKECPICKTPLKCCSNKCKKCTIDNDLLRHAFSIDEFSYDYVPQYTTLTKKRQYSV